MTTEAFDGPDYEPSDSGSVPYSSIDKDGGSSGERTVPAPWKAKRNAAEAMGHLPDPANGSCMNCGMIGSDLLRTCPKASPEVQIREKTRCTKCGGTGHFDGWNCSHCNANKGEVQIPEPMSATDWKILRDPARPTWPGVTITTPRFSDGFITVDAGDPKNFADSLALAERIVTALSGNHRASPRPDEEEKRDAAIGRWCLANAGWQRNETRDHFDYMTIPVAKGADLSCLAFRRDAIEAAMAASPRPTDALTREPAITDAPVPAIYPCIHGQWAGCILCRASSQKSPSEGALPVTPTPELGEWFAAFDRFEKLEQGWAGDARDKPPTKEQVDLTRKIFVALNALGVRPWRTAPSVDGDVLLHYAGQVTIHVEPPALSEVPGGDALRVSFRGGPVEAFSEERVLMALHAACSHVCAGEGDGTENHRIILGLHSALPLLLRDAIRLREAERQRDEARATLTKIDAIRNSIVGTQKVNWSAHIYPLVAALEEAGFKGLGYEKAKTEALTLLQQRDEARRELEAATSRLAQFREQVEQIHPMIPTLNLVKSKGQPAELHGCVMIPDPSWPNYGTIAETWLPKSQVLALLEHRASPLGPDATEEPT